MTVGREPPHGRMFPASSSQIMEGYLAKSLPPPPRVHYLRHLVRAVRPAAFGQPVALGRFYVLVHDVIQFLRAQKIARGGRERSVADA